MGESPHAHHPTLVRVEERVRQRRQELGLSQEDLGRRCGLHWSYLSQIENGRRNVSIFNATVIASALDIDAGRLIEGCRP